MWTKRSCWRHVIAAGGLLTLLTGILALVTIATRDAEASPFSRWRIRQDCCNPGGGIEFTGEPGGTWFWLRSPEEEKRVVIGLYNRYCIRCHGVDGRGVWDIPDVPDFTNARWQASRSDGQLARATLEGRGAVMPPFRGTMTLEEAWAVARYLRTFIPGTEVSRPNLKQPENPDPKKLEKLPK